MIPAAPQPVGQPQTDRCRIRIGPIDRTDPHPALPSITIPGVLSVIATPQRLLLIDYDPRRLSTERLVSHLEIEGVIHPTVRWVADPCPDSSA